MRKRSIIFGYVALIVLLTAGAAQGSLPGTGTVDSDDILNESILSQDVKNDNLTGADIKNESLTSSDILNNSLTGADINESTLAIPRMHEAQVTSGGDRKHGDATDANRLSTGEYDVHFVGFDVRSCMWVASEADFPSGTSLSHKRNVLSVKSDSDSNDVRVYVTANDLGARTNVGFTLLGVCR